VNLEQIGHDLDMLNEELQQAGAWVFADGLFPPATATVVHVQDGDVLMPMGHTSRARNTWAV
jgi:hypothetical protein